MAAYDTGSWTGNFRFMDSAGKVVYEYDPENKYEDSTSYKLSENEELIGVYGVKDKRRHFASFGFIVKVKANN